MSDLGGGPGAARASNGGARTGGPVPVPGPSSGTPIRTPRDVMRDRNAREARRQEQQREEEQRRLEERRRSAERRAATVPSAAPRFSQASSQYSPDVRAATDGQFDIGMAERRGSRVAGEVAGTNVLGEPTRRGAQDVPQARPRVPSVPVPDPLRPSQAASGASRRTQTSQAGPRQPAPAAAATSSSQPQPGPSIPGDSTQRNTQSSFPHAFERWETLSSHWEGLTSYWLHKLEQNTDDIRDSVPNASTLNRQITDLSAAGANLFHAVVELQRLRASSERKFQRWFFETRAETEKSRESLANMERQLKAERDSRDQVSRSQADSSILVENAKREVAETRRELMISKDEARRAWEELGRRNQESLDTAQSLKEGRVTLVSGVQVVPYFGQTSRTGSASQGQRPVTRDGQPGYGAGAAGLATPGDDREYYRDDGDSPTNTDPFTESGRQQPPPLHHEPGASSLAQGTYHPQGSTPASQATASTAVPATHGRQGSPAQQRGDAAALAGQQAAAAGPSSFYQHGGQASMLHPPTTAAQSIPIDVRSEGSYVESASEGETTEYVIDASGNIQRDPQTGRPVVFRRRQPARQPSSGSEDDFDTEEAVRRERELAAQYHGGMVPEAPSVPSTSAAAMQGFQVPAGGAGASSSAEPDYEGEAYDNYQQYVPRHQHPTRLSDVLEEEEERSSRRTGPD